MAENYEQTIWAINCRYLDELWVIFTGRLDMIVYINSKIDV